MGKKLIIKGADFSENGIQPENIVYLTQSMIMSGYNYYIANGKSAINNNSYKGGFIDISSYTGYETILLKKQSSKVLGRIAFVTQLPTDANQNISFATGYSDIITITDDDIHEYSLPSNAAYIYVMYENSGAGGNIFPSRLALKE
jgi:hypothetical protein